MAINDFRKHEYYIRNNIDLDKSVRTRFAFSVYDRVKRSFLRKLFWGRSYTYKNIVHILIFGITLVTALFGIFDRLSVQSFSKLASNRDIFSTVDLLFQGNNISTVIATVKEFSFIETINHTVQPGEDLISIAQKYNRRVETIRWMNRNVVSPFSNQIDVNSVIRIPTNVDGVMYTVKQGQNIYDIIRDTNSNEFDVVEFNNLKPPYILEPGQEIFIPDGTLYNPEVNVAGIPKGVFSNPAGHPDCQGYTISRGFLSYHNGVDLARWPGCPIRAVAAGTVIYAGWTPAMGYNVQIDHGGGIVTHYYHASEVYVTKGQRVQQDDVIIFMGTTGNSTGVHLHFSLFKDGRAIDPREFVPY